MTTPHLTELWEMTEEEARTYLESVRWPDGAVCPHCESKKVTYLNGKATRAGVYKCKDCRKQFTVTVNTIFHRSHIPLKKWVIAFHMLCSSKKGISALQLQRNLKLESYESAWHMAHRIRYAMTEGPMATLLKGTVEVDETYIGGKPRIKGVSKRGRGTKKTPVLALVSRDGSANSFPVERVSGKTLKTAIRENVESSARILTDELPSYGGIGKEFEGGHETVNHGRKEYARGDVNTNSVESYFALLKRGVHGTFHHISKRHLPRYCEEFAFRWSHRKESDSERALAALLQTSGKRLTYRDMIAG
jgi:transposase-like protein